MSLSDRLHLTHDNSTDERESETPPVGEEAVVDHPFTYPISTTAEKPASAVDSPWTTDGGHVDEPVATTDEDQLADEPLATTSSTDEPPLTADRDDDALVAAPPTDEPFAATATDEPPADDSLDDKSLENEPVAATSADEPSAVVTPTDEYTADSNSTDDLLDDGLVAPSATGVDSDEQVAGPVGTEATVPPVSTGIGDAVGDDRVKEPLADDFVTDAPQNPVFVAGTAHTDGVEPPVADVTEPPVVDAAGTPVADATTPPTVEGTEAPAASGKAQPGDWRDVLMEFVDHPREAVEKADRLVEDAVRSLTEQINREHSGLRDAWRTHGEPSTEDLRKALRGYRDFFEKVLSNH